MKKIKIMGLLLMIAEAVCITNIAVFAEDAEFNEFNKLFSVEFEDGDDRSFWRILGADGSVKTFDFDSAITDSSLKLTPNTASYGKFRAEFSDNPIHVENITSVYWETRLKFNYPEGSLRSDGTLPNDTQMFILQDFHQNHRVCIAIYNGALAYGGTPENPGLFTDYKMYNNTWYTIRAMMNFNTNVVSVYIVDENGNEYSGSETQFSYGEEIKDIYFVDFPRQLIANQETYIDYIRVWDGRFQLYDTSISDGEENVPADASLSMNFSDIPVEQTLTGIVVTDSDGNSVPYEVTANDKSAELFFSAGLKFNEEYTVNIPDTIKNSAGDSMIARSFSFVTESPIFSTGVPNVNVSGNNAQISVDVTNNGTTNKEICVLTVVYDQQNKVAKMVNNTFEIPVGMNDAVTATVDVTGISSPYVKAYVWNGVNIE